MTAPRLDEAIGALKVALISKSVNPTVSFLSGYAVPRALREAVEAVVAWFDGLKQLGALDEAAEGVEASRRFKERYHIVDNKPLLMELQEVMEPLRRSYSAGWRDARRHDHELVQRLRQEAEAAQGEVIKQRLVGDMRAAAADGQTRPGKVAATIFQATGAPTRAAEAMAAAGWYADGCRAFDARHRLERLGASDGDHYRALLAPLRSRYAEGWADGREVAQGDVRRLEAELRDRREEVIYVRAQLEAGKKSGREANDRLRKLVSELQDELAAARRRGNGEAPPFSSDYTNRASFEARPFNHEGD